MNKFGGKIKHLDPRLSSYIMGRQNEFKHNLPILFDAIYLVSSKNKLGDFCGLFRISELK